MTCCYWSDKGELLGKITTDFLPEAWKELVIKEEVELKDIPKEILEKAMLQAEVNFWRKRLDVAEMANGTMGGGKL